MEHSPALPIARVVLRILIWVNWIAGAAILALLMATFVAEEWTFTALGVPPSTAGRSILNGMRAIAVLGLAGIPLNAALLGRLLAIVETVREGDPFIAANADRLQAIGWVLLGLQVLSVVIGGIAKAVSTPAHPVHVGAGFSTNGWLAVLLAFVLARVFAHGARMREDLEGVV